MSEEIFSDSETEFEDYIEDILEQIVESPKSKPQKDLETFDITAISFGIKDDSNVNKNINNTHLTTGDDVDETCTCGMVMKTRASESRKGTLIYTCWYCSLIWKQPYNRYRCGGMRCLDVGRLICVSANNYY